MISVPDAVELGRGLFFRMMASEVDQAGLLAEYAVGKLKAKRVLVVREDSPIGLAAAQKFTEELKDRGGPAAEVLVFPSEAEGMEQLAARAADLKPNAVYLALHARPAVYVAQALARAEVKTTILGGHALALSDPVSMLGRLAEKAYVCLPLDPHAPSEAATAFIGRFQDKFKSFPTWPTITTYDAVTLAAEVLNETGESPEEAVTMLRQYVCPDRVFTGLAGDYCFRPGGAGLGPMAVVRADENLLGRVP